MKTLRALLSALALLALLAIPALGQTGNVTVSLDCYNDPEGVIVNNATDAAITVTGVTSSSEPDGDPERNLNVTVAAGATVRIAIGAEAGGSDNIFNNDLNESATVYTSVGNVMPTCEEAAGIGVGMENGDEVTTGQDEQEDVQDDQQAAMVTKTFTLTLKGDVPEDAIFPVFYATRDQLAADPEDPNVFLFCGQPPTEFGLEPKADCEAGVYTHTVQFEAGTEIAFAFARASETGPEDFEFFHQSFDGEQPSADDPGDFETLNTDFTNSAWFTFTAGDDQQEMPAMPNTGAGGLAPGASIPVGNEAAGLAMLVGAGYTVLRRR